MRIGMLWFDDGPQSLQERLARAVDYYTEKYGRAPTLCMVHPQTLNEGDCAASGVEVREATSVMPNHFWLGVDGRGNSGAGARRRAA
ncbi:MAG: hypothetical protein PVF70_03440 [Anaerolineales bacterium]|jgi:hypothetical protein